MARASASISSSDLTLQVVNKPPAAKTAPSTRCSPTINPPGTQLQGSTVRVASLVGCGVPSPKARGLLTSADHLACRSGPALRPGPVHLIDLQWTQNRACTQGDCPGTRPGSVVNLCTHGSRLLVPRWEGRPIGSLPASPAPWCRHSGFLNQIKYKAIACQGMVASRGSMAWPQSVCAHITTPSGLIASIALISCLRCAGAPLCSLKLLAC